MLKKLTIVATVCLLSIGFLFGTGLAAGPSLEKWKPAFDPSGAKYKFIVVSRLQAFFDAGRRS